MPTILDPILGLLTLLLFPADKVNTATGRQTYSMRFLNLLKLDYKSSTVTTPMASGKMSYSLYVPLMILPAPSKYEVIADGDDTVYFTNMPIPTHWKVSEGGVELDEFDYMQPAFDATFNPGGFYKFIISALGYETTYFTIHAIDPPVAE